MKQKVALVPAALAAIMTLAAPAFADAVVVRHHDDRLMGHHAMMGRRHIIVMRGHQHHRDPRVIIRRHVD